MTTATRPGSQLVTVLLALTMLCAILLIVMVVLCLPYFGQETPPAQLTTQPTEATEPSTQAPTEPTEPVEDDPTPVRIASIIPEFPENGGFLTTPPAANPYGHNDFQYDENNYLRCTSGFSVCGVDVSAYQEEIDWRKVKRSGIDFAIIRVAFRGYETGRLVEDAFARTNMEKARAAGVQVGVYIFSQAINKEEAAEEAAFLLDIIKDYDVTLPVVFDWEQVGVDTARTENMDQETLTELTLEFCRIVEEAGYTPMIYFNRYQAKYLTHLHEIKDYDFWLAAYTDRMRWPFKIRVWQYTDSGYVDGIPGKVDMNVWFEYS